MRMKAFENLPMPGSVVRFTVAKTYTLHLGQEIEDFTAQKECVEALVLSRRTRGPEIVLTLGDNMHGELVVDEKGVWTTHLGAGVFCTVEPL